MFTESRTIPGTREMLDTAEGLMGKPLRIVLFGSEELDDRVVPFMAENPIRISNVNRADSRHP